MRGRARGKTKATVVKKAIHILIKKFRFTELRLNHADREEGAAIRLQFDVTVRDYEERGYEKQLFEKHHLYENWYVGMVGSHIKSDDPFTRTLNFFIEQIWMT